MRPLDAALAAFVLAALSASAIARDGRKIFAFNAAIAGQFGVPVLFISGDDAIVKEARALLGDVEGAVVKWTCRS